MAIDIPYPVTFQPETAPSWLQHAVVLGGRRAPEEPFRYLELGCGRGYSVLLHAAGHPQGGFVAVDANAAAIAGARRGADASGLRNVRFEAMDFAACAAAIDGPFDFIVLHGVYSWVDAQTRAALRGILREKLAPGGVAYVSYNCQPGWAGELPLRRLLRETGGVGSGTAAVARLRAAGAAYFTANPAAERAVAGWAEQPEGYLAHEYLSEAWDCLWSADVQDEMASIGLAFAASATLRDQHEALLLDAEAAKAVAALPEGRQRMLALDFALNRGFRRDVFVKQAAADDGAALRALVVEAAGEIPESILVPRGRIGFQRDFIAALRALMAKGPQSLGDVVRALGESGDVARNVMWLVAGGALSPAIPDRAAQEHARSALSRIGMTLER